MRLTGRDVYVIRVSCEGQFTIVMISLGRTVAALAGCGKTIVARWTFKGPRVWGNGRIPGRMLKKARLLTRPTLAATSPARPESAKTASSARGAPYPMQGRSSETDPRFTLHASRFTVPGTEARTPLAGFFSILLSIVGLFLWAGPTWTIAAEGPAAAPPTSSIDQALNQATSEDESVREAAIRVLIEQGDVSLVPRLEEIRANADRSIRQAIKPLMDLLKNLSETHQFQHRRSPGSRRQPDNLRFIR